MIIIMIVFIILLCIMWSHLNEVKNKMSSMEKMLKKIQEEMQEKTIKDESIMQEQNSAFKANDWKDVIETNHKTVSASHNDTLPKYPPKVPVNYLSKHLVEDIKYQKEYSQAEGKETLENVFGKHVLGIVAAILVFIGMIAFGALIIKHLTDIGKVVMLFAFSFAITGLGVWLQKKKNTPFSASVTGCGVGATFISVFITHLYFELITDITAFALIFVWALLTYLLARYLRSNILLIVAHIGCLISILMANGYGGAEKKLAELMIYQIVITVFLLLIDYKTSKRLFKSTVFGFLVTNSIFMFRCVDYLDRYDFWISPAYTQIQMFIAVCILIFLACMVHIIGTKKYIKSPFVESVLTNILLLFHMYAFICAMVFVEMRLDIICLIMTVLFVFMLLGLQKISKTEIENKIFVLCNMTTLGFLYFFAACDSDKTFLLPGFLSFIILSALLYKKKKDITYFIASMCYLGLEAFLSLFLLNDIFLLWYEIILFAGSFVLYAFYSKDNIKQFSLFSYGLLDVCIMPGIFRFVYEIMKNADFNIPFVLSMILVTAANMAFFIVHRKCRDKNNIVDIISSVIINVGMHIIILENTIAVPVLLWGDTEKSVYILLIVLTFVSFFAGMTGITHINESLSPNLLGVWYMLKFTWFVLFSLGQFTEFLNEQFIFSLVCMVVATLCILFGFKINVKSVRVYGLIMILASVLKIVIIDVWGRTSIIRVAALMLGGLICFGISALYNRMENIHKEKIHI